MTDWALFGSALLSSPLFPGGSEALLLYRLHHGADPLDTVETATAGNVLGSLITYGMGQFGRLAVQRRSEKRIGILHAPSAGSSALAAPACCWRGCRWSAIRCAWSPRCCASASTVSCCW